MYATINPTLVVCCGPSLCVVCCVSWFCRVVCRVHRELGALQACVCHDFIVYTHLTHLPGLFACRCLMDTKHYLVFDCSCAWHAQVFPSSRMSWSSWYFIHVPSS